MVQTTICPNCPNQRGMGERENLLEFWDDNFHSWASLPPYLHKDSRGGTWAMGQSAIALVRFIMNAI